MKSERFFEMLNETDDALLLRTEKKDTRKLKRKLIAAVALAACLAVVCHTLSRFDYSLIPYANCGASPGIVAEGYYYYHVKHSGIYRYSPRTGSEKVLSSYWFEEFVLVNDYGVYYRQGHSIYVMPHETGKRTKLYTKPLGEGTHIRFDLRADGTVLLEFYDKHKELKSEYILDGKTGELLETLMPPTSYSVALYASERIFIIGEREFQLVLVDDKEAGAVYLLTENGENLLDEGLYARPYPTVFDEMIVFTVFDSDPLVRASDKRLIVHKDGENVLLEDSSEYFMSAFEHYLFFVENEEVFCMDSYTTEAWQLETNADIDIYEVRTDGKYAYTCVPWGEEQTCWRLVFDEDGKPSALALVSENIAE